MIRIEITRVFKRKEIIEKETEYFKIQREGNLTMKLFSISIRKPVRLLLDFSILKAIRLTFTIKEQNGIIVFATHDQVKNKYHIISTAQNCLNPSCDCKRMLHTRLPCSHLLCFCMNYQMNPYFLIDKRYNPSVEYDGFNGKFIAHLNKDELLHNPPIIKTKLKTKKNEDIEKINYLRLMNSFKDMITNVAKSSGLNNELLQDFQVLNEKYRKRIINSDTGTSKLIGRPSYKRKK